MQHSQKERDLWWNSNPQSQQAATQALQHAANALIKNKGTFLDASSL
jgi:hypothetical protein